MREFDELGFSERDIKFLEAHGLDTDRHMTTNEEVQKLFNAVLDMTEDELHEAMERYIPMPPMPEIVNPAVYAEYQEKRRIRQMLVWYPTVAKLAEEGNWEEFILRVSGIYELMPAVFRPGGLCEDAPDDIYRKLLVACYEHHGDGLLSVRARITDLPRRGAAALPPEYADADVITVYRAAEEDPEDSAESLSWTIKREVAEFFMYEYDKRHARYLLEAKLDVADVIDSATTMGKAMLSIAAVFAEMERDNIRTQTMSGREEKARKGYWNGGQAPYGYRLVDRGGKFKELVVDEDEAKVVRKIFQMYAYENKGAMAIAAWLNNHGVRKDARGNATMETFGNTTIARMIVNPVYVGKIAYGRRRTEVIEGMRGETHVVKSDGYEVYDGRHEAIIDEATWAAAQAIVGTRKPNAKRHDDGHVNLLNGLLVCPECGRKMSSHPNRGKVKKDGTRGKTTYAYYCPHTSKARGATCTFRRQYPQEYVDAEVVEMVKLASRSDAFVEALRRRINDETDVEQLREDAERIGREQAANDKRMRMLMNQIDALDPADRSYERKFSDLQRRLDDLYDRDAGFQEALEETRAKIAAADKRRVGERRLLDELDRIPELLEEADEQTRFDIVHEAVSEVRILADRNPRKERVVQSVTFKCPVRFFWEEVPGVADGYTAVTPDSFDADGNFRDDETHVECVALLVKA